MPLVALFWTQSLPWNRSKIPQVRGLGDIASRARGKQSIIRHHLQHTYSNSRQARWIGSPQSTDSTMNAIGPIMGCFPNAYFNRRTYGNC